MYDAGPQDAGDMYDHQPKREAGKELVKLFDGLSEVLEEHTPTHAAVEDIFFAKHANAALKLGHARGVAMLAVAQAGLDVESVPPAVVKKAVVGNGRATKAQVQLMVKVLLGLAEAPPEDAADALAVAICLANRGG